MKIILNLLLFISIVGISSCSKSGTKALEKGNYLEAVLQSTEKLRKDSDNQSAAEVLPIAYNNAKNQLLGEIGRFSSSGMGFRWEAIFDNYQKLTTMKNKIESCPACIRLVNPQNFNQELEEAREKAANERYLAAQQLMSYSSISKNTAREAYNHLSKLMEYYPNFQNSNNLAEKALFLASYHIVVEQPKINSRIYQYSNEYFQDKINEFLQTNRRLNKFVRFYAPDEIRSMKINPDQAIRLEILDFVVGETNLQSEKLNLISKDSVKTGEVTINGRKIPAYGKVKAQFTKFHKVVSSRGVLLFEVYDLLTKKTIHREEIGGNYNWVNDWANFNGDERALSSSELNLCKNRELAPPPAQQMFVEFTKPIYDQVTSKIRRFYSNY